MLQCNSSITTFHKVQFLLCSFNRTISDEMPLHPTLFRYVAVLHDSVLQNSASVVAQVEAGTFKKKKLTRAQERLNEKAREIEENYRNGLITANTLLHVAADHYSDRLVEEVLTSANTSNDGENMDDEEGGERQEDNEWVDDRQREVDEDSDLADNDPDGWVVATWPEAEQPSPPNSQPLLSHEDPQTACAQACSVCNYYCNN